MDFREAFETLPVADLVSLIRKLPVDSATSRSELGAWAYWDAHKENTARLLEVQDYLLQLLWIDRTTDPEDREVKLQRAAAKRAGLKPPKAPIIPPVAMRPGALSEERIAAYMERLAEQDVPAVKQAGSRQAFDRQHGLET